MAAVPILVNHGHHLDIHTKIISLLFLSPEVHTYYVPSIDAYILTYFVCRYIHKQVTIVKACGCHTLTFILNCMMPSLITCKVHRLGT